MSQNPKLPVMHSSSSQLHHGEPTRVSAAIFSTKAMLLRNLRRLSDLKRPLQRFDQGQLSDYPALLAESRSPLWTAESQVETALQFGKVQNLRKACGKLHQVAVSADQIFSFWKQVGKARKSSGYTRGRELRQGCLIPTVGGGLCQLSNHLYDLALRTGCTVVERHAHTAVVPGSAAEHGRDATVFWNYVDLRFSPRQDILITAFLSKDELILSFRGKQGLRSCKEHKAEFLPGPEVKTCTDCGVKNCFRHVRSINAKSSGKSAFLIEECWPEFNEFANQVKAATDELFIPWHSKHFHLLPRYDWDTIGYSKIVTANLKTVLSSLKARVGLAEHLPAIAVQIHRSHELAGYYSQRLSPEISRLYVAQTLLPFLWRSGDLGGRHFSVLMTRWPLNVLHEKLDDLVRRFPQRGTFAEFRAPDWMVEAESEALEHADTVVTPHASIAALFPRKIQRLDWKLPGTIQNRRGECIVFPGPTVARKGAYEVRQSLKGVKEKLLVLGNNLESEDFWLGLNLSGPGKDWIHQALLVVQPAFIENAPRPLLRALSAGIPVIATPECGIASHRRLILVPSGDQEALKLALTKVLQKQTKDAPANLVT
jgi:hypothetical protein